MGVLSRLPIEKVAYSFFGVVFLVLVYQSFFWTPVVKPFSLEPSGECVGESLFVSYPYEGRVLDPHACAPQCADQRQRYIVYTNGYATQCETVPGCSDWGEDRGKTCRIPT